MFSQLFITGIVVGFGLGILVTILIAMWFYKFYSEKEGKHGLSRRSRHLRNEEMQ